VILGHLQGLGSSHDAKLFTIKTYKSHLGNANFTVDAMSFIGCDI